MENLRLKITNARKRIANFEAMQKTSDSITWSMLIKSELWLIERWEKRLSTK